MTRTMVTAARSLAVALVVAGLHLATDAPGAQTRKRLLVMTHTMAARHMSLANMEATMQALAERSGDFKITSHRGYTLESEDVDLSWFTADYLSDFDGVMFMTSGELPLDANQKQALLDFVRNGKAWMGAHSAGATNYTWPGYGELLGGYYEIAGSNNRVQILKVEDQDHPATGFLGLFWPLAAEIYTIGHEVWDPSRPDENRNSFGTPIPVAFSRQRSHVLLSLDSALSDLTDQRGKVTGGDYPIAWCHPYGEGRVFYTALGHREGLWNNLVFQEHVLGGVRWALGLEPGDCSPDRP